MPAPKFASTPWDLTTVVSSRNGIGESILVSVCLGNPQTDAFQHFSIILDYKHIDDFAFAISSMSKFSKTCTVSITVESMNIK